MIVGNRYEDGKILELGFGTRRGGYNAIATNTNHLYISEGEYAMSTCERCAIFCGDRSFAFD